MYLYKRSTGEKVFNVFNIAFMVIITAVTLYPFVNVAAISFSSGPAAATNPNILFPVDFTLKNYEVALRYPEIKTAALVSIGRVILGTLLHMLCTCMAAYAFTKRDLLFRKQLLFLFMVPMFVSTGLIPVYINFKMLHLLNNFLVYILPGAFGFFDFILIRTYMDGLPQGLEESAYMDGANHARIFAAIIVPLCKPVIAAISLFTAVGLWNDWFTSLVFVSNPKMHVLQYLLQKVLQEEMSREILKNTPIGAELEKEGVRQVTVLTIRMAILMVTTAPILLIYPFVQKHFEKGMMLGSIKG